MNTHTSQTSWLDRPLCAWLKLDYEKGLYLLLILAAFITRFYNLGVRVMSHDESLHTYYSWNLSMGRGFSHTPLMHGPFLFHINALLYSLFGADDFTARISVALFGVALVALPWTLRRWLGRAGALVASAMFLISPSIMYHARYIRNESFVTVWVMLIVWGMLAYWHTRENKWLYLFAAASLLLFATKEVAFIYTAIFSTFILLRLIAQLVHSDRLGMERLARLGGAVTLSLIIVVVTMALHKVLLDLLGVGVSMTIAADGIPKETSGPDLSIGSVVLYLFLMGLVGLAAAGGIYALLRYLLPDVDRASGKTARATFDLLIVIGTLYLPALSPFAMHILRIDPMDYGTAGIVRAGGIFVTFVLISIAVGLWWDVKRWLISAAVWYGIGLTLFTTIFSNGAGLASGFIGSLGYWLAQHGVQRGSQPVYYYFVITPLYEYLPILISLVAAIYYVLRGPAVNRADAPTDALAESSVTPLSRSTVITLLIYWVAMSWGIYSYAGEKMPWLMVHLAMPMILLSSIFLGEIIEAIPYKSLGRAWLAALLAPLILIGIVSLANAMAAGAFQGNQVPNMVATGQWITALLIIVGAAVGLGFVVMQTGVKKVVQVSSMVIVALLALSTFRTAWRWCFINYDYPTEHGVYAHGGPGVKLAMKQIEEIADRTVGRSALKIAYDSDSSWPFSWYLRDYPAQAMYGTQPTREALDAPVVLAGSASWSAVEPILGKRYDQFTYRLIWWPMEDYKRLAECPLYQTAPDGAIVYIAAYDENRDGTLDNAEKARGQARCSSYTLRNSLTIIWEWVSQPQRRAALWDIFWYRDYTKYDQVTGKKHTIAQWPLVHDFKLYVRKDVAAQVWDLGVGPVVAREPYVDPYTKGRRDVAAIQVIGSIGSAAGQFSSPHGLAVGPDGSLYVADSGNHRILKFSTQGEHLLSFGAFGANAPSAAAPPGTFNEPWGVAVGPDGSVYVADTWNHRIQKFTPDGKFITMWGQAGQTDGTIRDDPAAYYIMWGPRGVAVDAKGNVYVTDTGDKRVVVFDSNGTYLRQFGGKGAAPGQLDEPVGIAISPEGNVVVADTWNLRVQVFSPEGVQIYSWPIEGWTNQAVTTKPYLAVDKNGYVYVTDPTGFRVLVFGADGNFVATFGDVGADAKSFRLPIGIAVDNAGNVYVSDADTGRILKFAPVVP